MSLTEAIRRWLSPPLRGGIEPWPGRPHVSTELLRDWWVAECWFHKGRELAEAHFEGFARWARKQPPSSLSYAPWSPFTRVRVDLSCLGDAPIRSLHDECRDGSSHFYVVAYCCARNELREIEHYRTCWRHSEEYKPYILLAENKYGVWPHMGYGCTPKWYYENVIKTVDSLWIGYHGVEGAGA